VSSQKQIQKQFTTCRHHKALQCGNSSHLSVTIFIHFNLLLCQGFVFAFVCSSVSKITQKDVDNW